MANNAHRFSIEWSRIEPREGKFSEEEIAHYKKVITALRERGLEPFVTLHHFTNPVWFADYGGWENSKAPAYFARYASYMAKKLPEVKYWITINEPMVMATKGWTEGTWPPFKKNWNGAFKVAHNLTKAHNAAYRALKKNNDDLRVGVAKNNIYFDAYKNGLLSKLGVIFFDYAWNRWFLNRIKNNQDFVGINYYFHNTIRARFSAPSKWMNYNGNKRVSNFGWEIYPEGIYHVTKQAWEKYKKPVFIFENGIADAKDRQRAEFIKDHLKWLYKAIEEGADVRGYFHWSLLDNFEWAEGFTMKFGLVEMDFETLERKPRNSYYLYKEICEKNGL